MRLSSLEFLRYGHFDGSSLALPKASLDLHLVVGRNESGKSTARSAISDLLFGFGARTPYAFLHDMSALRVGAEIERGEERLSFYRRKGNKDTLRDGEDRPLRDDVLAGYLAGADREYFERMFSLDQPSLVAGAKSMLEAGDDLARLVFQASAGLRGLGDVLKALEAEADALWAPRKSQSRAYYQALEQFEAAQRTLKETVVRASSWEAARKAVESAEAKLKAAVERDGRIKRDKAKLERVSRTAPLLHKLRELASSLEQTKDVAILPDHAATTWSQVTEALAWCSSQEEELRGELEEAERRLEALVVDEAILGREAAVLDLQKKEAAYSRHPADLDKRRAELARLEEAARKQARALGWKVDAIDAIADLIPAKLVLRRLTDLSAQASSLRVAHQRSERALADAQRRHAALTAERDRLVAEGAPASLRDALAQARGLGDTEARRAELEDALFEAERKLERLLPSLHPFSGELSALAEIRPPDVAVASRAHQQLTTIAERRRDASTERERLQDQIRDAEVRERQIQRDGAPVGPDELRAARDARDAAWRLAKTELLSPSSSADRVALAADVEGALEEADRLADRRYEASEAWAKLLEIQNARELLESKLTRLEGLLAALDGEEEGARDAWRATLAAVGMPELAPDAVASWIKLRSDALEQVDAVRSARERLAASSAGEAKAIEQLRAALHAAGDDEIHTLALAALVARAEALATTRDEARARRDQMTEQLRQGERDLADLDEEVRRSAEALASWDEQWRKAVEAAGLPSSLDPDEGDGVVDGLRELGATIDKITELKTERIETMERDLSFFHARALEVAGELAHEPAGLSPGELVQALTARLEVAKQTRADRQRAQADVDGLEKKLASAVDKRREAEARLAPLHAAAKTETDEDLREAIGRSEWVLAQRREVQACEQSLGQVADGLPREQLEEEAAAEDLSTLAVRLEEVTRELDEIAGLREGLAVEAQQAKSAFEAIGGSEQAAVAESQRQQALAAMSTAVERWIRIRTAARTLRWAIERFRQQRQDPLLRRASAIFSTLTLGEFERLAVDFDDKDQPRLVGVRTGTSALVPITGLSTGTADQLYLALRIAALELHLESRPALPFVADDLFVHFDDARAEAGFRVLADLSKRTQVLFFTHHEHLVEIAARAIGGEAPSVVQLGSGSEPA